jgi:hypothetical protein
MSARAFRDVAAIAFIVACVLASAVAYARAWSLF